MEVKRECDEHVLHHFAIWQIQTHPAVLRGSKESRMRIKVPSTTTLSFPTLSPLLTAGKNKVGYILDRVVDYALEYLWNCGLIPGKNKRFSHLHDIQIISGAGSSSG
jgi:hypothetical protein